MCKKIFIKLLFSQNTNLTRMALFIKQTKSLVHHQLSNIFQIPSEFRIPFLYHPVWCQPTSLQDQLSSQNHLPLHQLCPQLHHSAPNSTTLPYIANWRSAHKVINICGTTMEDAEIVQDTTHTCKQGHLLRIMSAWFGQDFPLVFQQAKSSLNCVPATTETLVVWFICITHISFLRKRLEKIGQQGICTIPTR